MLNNEELQNKEDQELHEFFEKEKVEVRLFSTIEYIKYLLENQSKDLNPFCTVYTGLISMETNELTIIKEISFDSAKLSINYTDFLTAVSFDFPDAQDPAFGEIVSIWKIHQENIMKYLNSEEYYVLTAVKISDGLNMEATLDLFTPALGCVGLPVSGDGLQFNFVMSSKDCTVSAGDESLEEALHKELEELYAENIRLEKDVAAGKIEVESLKRELHEAEEDYYKTRTEIEQVEIEQEETEIEEYIVAETDKREIRKIKEEHRKEMLAVEGAKQAFLHEKSVEGIKNSIVKGTGEQ